MKTEHTPFPWRVDNTGGELLIASDGPGLCASINPPGTKANAEDKANAAFIVRACNSHIELATACSMALDFAIADGYGESSVYVTKLRDALAKAKG